jgi:hypothetical protein
MLKTFKDFALENKAFYQGEDMLLSIGKAKEINSPLLYPYIKDGYKESDYEQIQKAINYTVVRFIKTDKTFNNTIDTLKRWKYVRDMIQEYHTEFPHIQFNLKSFNRLKEDIIKELFK